MNRANSAQTTTTIGSPAASQGQIYKDICFSAKEAHLERHPIIIRFGRKGKRYPSRILIGRPSGPTVVHLPIPHSYSILLKLPE